MLDCHTKGVQRFSGTPSCWTVYNKRTPTPCWTVYNSPTILGGIAVEPTVIIVHSQARSTYSNQSEPGQLPSFKADVDLSLHVTTNNKLLHHVYETANVSLRQPQWRKILERLQQQHNVHPHETQDGACIRRADQFEVPRASGRRTGHGICA